MLERSTLDARTLNTQHLMHNTRHSNTQLGRGRDLYISRKIGEDKIWDLLTVYPEVDWLIRDSFRRWDSKVETEQWEFTIFDCLPTCIFDCLDECRLDRAMRDHVDSPFISSFPSLSTWTLDNRSMYLSTQGRTLTIPVHFHSSFLVGIPAHPLSFSSACCTATRMTPCLEPPSRRVYRFSGRTLTFFIS